MVQLDIVRRFTTVLTSMVQLAGYDYNHSRSSPPRSSPDVASSMSPQRRILPLPKRPLRARLSPEQAGRIEYPPPVSTPLFNFPQSPAEGRSSSRAERRRGESDRHACDCGQNHPEAESEEDEDERGAALPSSPSYHYSKNAAGRQASAGYPKPAASTASSADGYDSFENTNNKKKRKIPNMGSTSTHHANLSTDMASMGTAHQHGKHSSGALEEGEGPERYYASAPSTPQHSGSGTGISGAGRGRFGRAASSSVRSERRVLNIANTKAGNKRALPGPTSAN